MKYAVPIVILIVALLAASSIYVVGAGHAAAVSGFGRVQQVGMGPGLHFRVPFVSNVSVYDTRAIISQADPVECRTRDGQTVRVAFSVRWQIVDAAAYFKASGGDESRAVQQILGAVRSHMCASVAKYTVAALLDSGRNAAGAGARTALGASLRNTLGVDVQAVAVGRVLPPEAALAAVYKHMQAEAGAAAANVHEQGETAAAAIRAAGSAQTDAVLADAQQAAAVVRGEGDAEAAKIDAAAAKADPQFFSFWSGVQAWRQSFAKGGAVVVLDQGSPFMRQVDAGAAPSAGHGTAKH